MIDIVLATTDLVLTILFMTIVIGIFLFIAGCVVYYMFCLMNEIMLGD